MRTRLHLTRGRLIGDFEWKICRNWDKHFISQVKCRIPLFIPRKGIPFNENSLQETFLQTLQ